MTMSNDQSGPRFTQLTGKQLEVLSLLADGRTSKEVSHALKVSESAVNQRIEAIRVRFGGLPRSEIVRRYRQWSSTTEPTCKNLTGGKIQLLNEPRINDPWLRETEGPTIELADAATFEMRAPWQYDEPKVVPEELDGPYGDLQRVFVISKIAVGISVALLTLLAVGNSLTALLR